MPMTLEPNGWHCLHNATELTTVLHIANTNSVKIQSNYRLLADSNSGIW